MRRKRLLWQIYPAFLLLTAVSLIAVSWYAHRALGNYYEQRAASDLHAHAQLLTTILAPRLIAQDYAGADSLCKTIVLDSAMVVTAILPNGEVIADSRDTPRSIDNQSSRPEIVTALSGLPGVSERYNARFAEEMDFVALPVLAGHQIVAVVRVGISQSAVKDALTAIYLRLGIGALIVAALAALFSLLVARRISRPLQDIKAAAERIAQGDLDNRLPESEFEEMAGVSESMNLMAGQLDERFKNAARQRIEQQAIVSSMIEGVIAIDVDQRVMSLNAAAANLLCLKADDAVGRTILELTRNNDLQRLVAKTFTVGEPVEGDIGIGDIAGNGRYLQAHGTLLRDPGGHSLGALVVLNDVTRLRKLESVRRDFVANVSHELKTPITSIKGFIETLIDNESMSTEERRRFLDIIARQSNRLHAIIEDLLRLSRIEQESERGEIPLELGNIGEVIKAAIAACEPQARTKGVTIRANDTATLRARINPPLLEQALVNLIDNAIKYSDPGTEVAVTGAVNDRLVTIAVRDQGSGVAKEHLPRLFERFYRVDRARSREQGGTGLGLAIVKHIILAHGGNVTVQSEIGQGSTFTISLSRS